MNQDESKLNFFQKIKALPYTQRWFLFCTSVVLWLLVIYFFSDTAETEGYLISNKGLFTLLFISLATAVFFRRRKNES
jgi:hypothetical protein